MSCTIPYHRSCVGLSSKICMAYHVFASLHCEGGQTLFFIVCLQWEMLLILVFSKQNSVSFYSFLMGMGTGVHKFHHSHQDVRSYIQKCWEWRGMWPGNSALQMLHAGLPRISTTISGHCWRSKNEVVSDLVLWEPKHGKRSAGGQAGTFVDLLEADTRSPETACRQRWITGLAGEREPWGVN